MSVDEIKVVGLTKIDVEEDDYLYIQLPKDLSHETLHNALRSIHEFFEGRKVKVLSGDLEIKFSSVRFNEDEK